MKLTNLATLGVLALSGSLSVQAQYFSEGWKPGQPVKQTTAVEPQVTYVPGEGIKSGSPDSPKGQEAPPAKPTMKPSLMNLLDPEKLLGTVLQKLGYNITSHLEDQKIWDERITLVTDDNFNELIKEEEFASDEEAQDRTWVIAITASKNKQEPLSTLVDQMFDSAYAKTLEAGDLPHVRWGRIDYFNVTYVTTKWNIWKAPYLVVLKDRGQTLHFFRPGNIRIHDDSLREFLKTNGFRQLPPWSGRWAPGGESEWILDFFAVWMARSYNVLTKIPKWMLFIVTGSAGSFIISFLHKPGKTSVLDKTTTPGDVKTREAASSTPSSPAAAAAAPVASAVNGTSSKHRTPDSPPAKRASARQRKGKKATV